jgi:hypothetical protein
MREALWPLDSLSGENHFDLQLAPQGSDLDLGIALLEDMQHGGVVR